MNLSRGPVRIVLIRSGGYDHAELPLYEPVHLIAANNVGKTTLIAALQFLYIDDLRQMHFSHDWGETRRHYFPGAGSLVLFECMTPTGLRVFGLRGLGPVQGFEYERFTYAGAYERMDFLDGRTARPWDNVGRRLVARGLTFMEPRHLRASLTGSGEAGAPPLGLVPLKRAGSYESFRFLLRNLLRLSRIDQEQLKQLFIDISGERLRKERVDLRKDYKENFEQVTRDAADVEALQRIAPAIGQLVELFESREKLRGRVAGLWRVIEDGLQAEMAGTSAALEALRAERATLTESGKKLDAEQAVLNARNSTAEQERGVARAEVNRIEKLGVSVRDFVPSIEAVRRQQLEAREEGLVGRLAVATRAERGIVERELRAVSESLARDRRLVERYADAMVTWLRRHAQLSDAALSDTFRVLNPGLLGEIIGDGHARVVDPAALVQALKVVSSGFGSDGFRSFGVDLPRTVLPAQEPLVAYQDVEAIRERINAGIAKERELTSVLADLDAREELTRERDRVRRDLSAANERFRQWTTWCEDEPRLKELVAQLEQLSAVIARIAADLLASQEKSTSIRLRLAEIGAAEQAQRGAREAHVAEVQRLQAPPPDWPPAAEGLGHLTLDEAIREFRVDSTEQRRVDTQLSNLAADVENKTAGRHLGATQEETIRLLEDELAALADRELALKDLWTSLVDGMRNDFKALVEGVDAIRQAVSRLTQALSTRRVSNLEHIELELVRQGDLIRRLEDAIRAEVAPLFAGPGAKSRAASEIESWLKDRPVIEIAELFDLRFKVIDRLGHTKTFDSLTQIESQGTSTTIKVLVHLELLRTMLADDRIAVPFFLDEVATLDERNLKGLIDHATAMGFVPIVASPEARDTVSVLYFLRPSTGGLVLDETSRVVLQRASDHGA